MLLNGYTVENVMSSQRQSEEVPGVEVNSWYRIRFDISRPSPLGVIALRVLPLTSTDENHRTLNALKVSVSDKGELVDFDPGHT